MTRNFIDYGIDLGTTNSCIAVFENGEPKVIKKGYSDDYIPSAVGYDRQGSINVGQSPKDKLDIDPKNTFSEFKLQMGTDWNVNVPNGNRRVTPVDLSAEVLKALKGIVQESLVTDKDVSAAVITVPAAFGQAQLEATKQAAQKAGILLSPLVQEPIAAGLAYGFERTGQKGFWLVYDFGGGTFDAAIIKSDGEGIIQVVNHGGDNHLGGKLIDWAIVEELLIPEIKRVHGWTDFGRSNPNWIGAIAKLKQEAEKAKIRLSSDPTYEIENVYLESGDGKLGRFEYTLKKEQVESLSERYILQSINISKKVLSEKNMQPGDIEKVLLVGGPTMMPYLQERLKDPIDGLGIALEKTINPMTVVAQGAAIHAANKPKEPTSRSPISPKPGGYRITNLDHQPIGNDPEPRVGGIVISSNNEEDLSDYKIEFINKEARIPWESGKHPLSANGKFQLKLWAPDKNSTFRIELTDPQGNKLDIEPKSISRTIGSETPEQPFAHSIGIALVNNKVEWLCKKGTSLPYKKFFKDVFCSAYNFGPEMGNSTFKMPIVEGENEKADRNKLIGSLEITPLDLKSSLKAGTEIKIEIEIDESSLITAKAYTPVLQKEIELKINLQEKTDIARLIERTEEIMKRYEDVKRRTLEINEPKPLAILTDLGRSGIIKEINEQKAALSSADDAPGALENKLRELTVEIDDVEDFLEIPEAKAQAHDAILFAQDAVENGGDDVDRQNFPHRKREMINVIENGNLETLRLKTALMNDFAYQILRRYPQTWIDWFIYLRDEINPFDYTNPELAAELLAQGGNAMQANELERLQTTVRQLCQLLPLNGQQKNPFGTGTGKRDNYKVL